MYYFIGNNLGQTLTGIEKAQLNRLKLFRANGLEAMCVYTAFNPGLYANAKKFKVSDGVMSIYDYFQKAIDFQGDYFDWIKHWEDAGYTLKYVQNTRDVRVYDQGDYTIYAHFSDVSFKKISYINYFDHRGRKFKREIFDSRGFLSVRKYLTMKQKVLFEHILNTDGEIVIEKYYDPEADKQTLTRILLNFNGEVKYLKDNSDLLTIFTNAVYSKGDIFFSDKNNVTAKGLANSRPEIPLAAVLHSTHLKYEKRAELANIKNTYRDLFDYLDRFDCLITSTVQQKEDVSKLIDNKIPVYNIPVGFIGGDDTLDKHPASDVPRLISVARYAVEKQLDHQIRLIKRLNEKFPNVELHMFGAGAEHAKLKSLIDENNLGDNVFLRGFVPDLQHEFQQSHINLLTSRMEGFSLALLEAASYGVPSVSYDIEYGPAEIIKNNENGYLIPLDDEDVLYEKVEALLSDASLLVKFRENVIEDRKRFSESETLSKWQAVLASL